MVTLYIIFGLYVCRFNIKAALADEVELYHRNLSLLLKSGANPIAAGSVLDTYNDKLRQLADIEDEVVWNMISASEFVSSVMTTLVGNSIIILDLCDFLAHFWDHLLAIF